MEKLTRDYDPCNRGLWDLVWHLAEDKAKTIVDSVKPGQGFDAWASLHAHYEPENAQAEQRARTILQMMTGKKATSTTDTRNKLVEMDAVCREIVEHEGTVEDGRR